MRIVRNPLAMALSIVLAFAAAQGCGKSDSKKDGDGKKNEGGGGNGGDANPTDDDLLKDDFNGIYQVQSQLETPFGGCDESEAEAVEGMGQLTFFKLENTFEFTMDPASEPKTDLWLHECSDAATCQGPVAGFMFPEKTDGVWGGQSSLSISDSPFEPGKCTFGYTERSAKLSGKDIVITTTSYMGEVAPLGGGCMHDDGGSDLEVYYKTYRGKIACDGVETIKGLKLDVPMPE